MKEKTPAASSAALKKIAVNLTAIMTLATLILRVALTPLMQDPVTGAFHLSYITIAVMLAAMIAAALLSARSAPARVPVRGKVLMPAALLLMLAGSVMIVTNAVDACIWMTTGLTPPPNTTVISGIDRITLILTIVFGLLGGAMLVRAGLLWLSENRSRTGSFRLWALAPVLWVWMRLARYEVSYASAVDVGQSFYDFVMLIFLLLFLFAFARYIPGVGQNRSRLLFFFSLMTALFALSGPLTRVFLYMTGHGDAYNASELAGVTDGLLGAFALVFAYSQAYGKPEQEPSPEPAQEAAGPQDAVPENADGSLEEILSDYANPHPPQD